MSFRTADPRRELFLSSIGAAGNEKCFEELRVADYLQAYTTTGRPPPPCPPQPTGPAERLALGLPALFVPWSDPALGPTLPPAVTLDIAAASAALVPKPEANILLVPSPQIFRQTREAESGDVYQSLSAQQESQYNQHSHEEMRVQAYRNGLIYVPNLPPPILTPSIFTSGGGTVAITPTRPSLLTSGVMYNNGEQLLTITAQETYNRHCQEELRVAYLLHGREMTSAELLPSTPPPAIPTPSLFGATPPAAPAPANVFGSSAFSFGAPVRQF